MSEGIRRPKGYRRLRDAAPPRPDHPCACAKPTVWPGIPLCCGCSGTLTEQQIKDGTP